MLGAGRGHHAAGARRQPPAQRSAGFLCPHGRAGRVDAGAPDRDRRAAGRSGQRRCVAAFPGGSRDAPAGGLAGRCRVRGQSRGVLRRGAGRYRRRADGPAAGHRRPGGAHRRQPRPALQCVRADRAGARRADLLSHQSPRRPARARRGRGRYDPRDPGRHAHGVGLCAAAPDAAVGDLVDFQRSLCRSGGAGRLVDPEAGRRPHRQCLGVFGVRVFGPAQVRPDDHRHRARRPAGRAPRGAADRAGRLGRSQALRGQHGRGGARGRAGARRGPAPVVRRRGRQPGRRRRRQHGLAAAGFPRSAHSRRGAGRVRRSGTGRASRAAGRRRRVRRGVQPHRNRLCAALSGARACSG
ncbi:Uncharacterised protein [Bordetella parapertussis]|nr:Uncharacterised protein [Bordetella parapertussis]SUV60014.1 Uncharacterised protein [Bordetella parapertussis]SUV81075.1 Uncharacterised protein [Bordetella parapertussis]VEF51911.1 Uncharacterised protein [Bordetella parapertussis]VTR42616.1 Uncharacterised protein [Bordetella parapertussis]